MTFSNSRSVVLHYALLVAVPFGGVLAVLDRGTKLTPPRAVEGRWLMEADLEANARTVCSDHLSGFHEPVLQVAQSGVFLVITLSNPSRDRLTGRLEDGHFLAEAKPRLFGDDVFNLLRVSGDLGREEGQTVMRGLMAMPRRVECVPVPFRARKEERAR